MTEMTEQPTVPRLTWLPMAAWSALAVLGLCFGCSGAKGVAVPMTSRPDIPDSPVGPLRYLVQAKVYEGRAGVGGATVKILLELDEHGDIAPSLARAKVVLADKKRFGENAKDYAAQRLLKLKNESWLDEDEKPLSAEQFKVKMRLVEISFSSDGQVEFWYDDGQLFWGHSIQVIMDGKDQFVDVDIPG